MKTIIRNCDNCGNEDSVSCDSGLCPSCENKEENINMKETEIMWDDLTEEVKEGIAMDRNTTPEKLCKDRNFDVVPIAVINI